MKFARRLTSVSGQSVRADFSAGKSHSAQRSIQLAAQTVVESLETRRLLSVAMVNSPADTDARDTGLTLREAIEYVNGTLAFSSMSASEQAQINQTQPLGTNDTIDFNIPNPISIPDYVVRTISMDSPLPTISKAVTIDGYSQPGETAATSTAVANMKIRLDGTNAGDGESGLVVGATGVVIDGLTLNHFSGYGIQLTAGSGNDVIKGNYIGIDPTGASAEGNGEIDPNGGYEGGGVGITTTSFNDTIGGTDAADRNVISGNIGDGVKYEPIDEEDAGNDVIEGNYIGTDATGSAAVANPIGIFAYEGDALQVGGTAAGAGNLISGNTDAGVEFEFFIDGVAQGNRIGTDSTGKIALPNGVGISFFHASATIGGTTPNAGNVISGNTGDGITGSSGGLTVQGNFIGTDLTGSSAVPNGGDGLDVFRAFDTVTVTGNVISANKGNGIDFDDAFTASIAGNKIGTDVSGKVALGNGMDGILVGDGSSNVTVGGSDAADRNIISANKANGVEVGHEDEYGTASTDAIYNNYIGLGVDGSAVLGNALAGVLIDGGASDIAVGAPGEGNVISGNGTAGVQIDDTNGNTVAGNYIGVDATGEFWRGDGQAGVLLDLGAMNNVIGGTVPGARNVIAGIQGAAVYIAGTHMNYSGGTPQPVLTNSNTVEGNYIGTDATGTTAIAYPDSGSNGEFFGYDGNGIYIDTGAFNNTIGGVAPGARNVISGNPGTGVHLSNAGTNNTVAGNYIGVDATGAKALGNGYYGVQNDSTNSTTIGGTAAGAGNVISGNGATFSYAGIDINTSGQDVVQGNYIGTDSTGGGAIGNLGAGVLVEFGSQNITIGGAVAAAGNVIANNGGAGVAVAQYSTIDSSGAGVPQSINNPIRYNSIFANSGLGIDLELDGVTANDPQDADGGGNDRQNFPVLVTATSTGSSVTLTGTFNSLPNTNFTLDFYANDTVDAHGNGQGKQYVGSIGVLTDSNGNATFSSTFNVAIGSNKYITSTATVGATAPYGDTSEFSQAVEATTGSNGGGGTTTPPPVPPSVSINDVKQNEGNSGTAAFTFTLTRTGDLTAASTVTISTADGTATAGSDYTKVDGQTVTFAAGAATATATVTVNGDTTVEGDETFNVIVSAVTNATIGDSVGQGTIVNDDVAPPVLPSLTINDVTNNEGNAGTASYTFTITRSGDLSGVSTVDYSTANSSATSPSDFTATSGTATFTANQATATVTVLVNGDTAVESNETFNVNLANATNATIADGQGVGTIVNDDAAAAPSVAINDVSKAEGNSGTTAFTFTLTRTGDLSASSIVSVSTAGGSATPGSDYAAQSGTLVAFAASQATATVTINVNGDTAVESDETFDVNVTSITNATTSDGQGVGTIVNDDVAPPPLPRIAINDVTKNEGNSGTTSFTFTLTRSGDLSKASSVSVSTADNTALSASDYTALNATKVTFGVNQATATVTVLVKGDTTVESNETFFVNVTALTNATISDGQGVGTIVNDDVPPPVTVKAPSNLTGSATSSSAVSLKWKDNASNQTGFEIQYSTSSIFSSVSTLGIVGANVTSANIGGLNANTMYYFRIRAVGPNSSASPYSNTLLLTTQKAPVPAPVVTGFNLINTDTGKIVMTITNGMVIHRSSLPSLKHFTVQAVVSGAAESVRFGYQNDRDYLTADWSPYTLFGSNRNGFYVGAAFTNGIYKVTATPYTKDDANGIAGALAAIQFTVVN